ncbi:alpha/beta hydrolase [Pilimelia columellifera]|uniref:Alpha/beta hydrolase n=1 Tax=Pilimelia columellifera subsp. columellifera TaxID=706583 RepID=A0ABN3NNW4_9ACTN
MTKSVLASCAAIAVAGSLLALSSGSASATTSATPGAATSAAAETIVWTACTNETLAKRGAQCGYVTAPLDYAKPDGEKIQLAVSRIKHKTADAAAQGPMLVNPGGPGGSGLTLSVLGERVPGGAGDAYDWVGFDPRGVGESKPAISCDPQVFAYNRPEYVPSTKAIEVANLKRAKAYAEACRRSGGALLNNIETVDTIRDMETIRVALGADRISFYGFSYGSYLGQVYATMFPKRIHRMVIDGVVDHRNVWYKANLNQNIAFDANVKTFFQWIAQNDTVYKLGPTGREVEKRYYATSVQLGRKPAGGLIGSSEFADMFLPAGYSQGRWKAIAAAFSGWVNNQDEAAAAALKAAYDYANGPGDDNSYAVYLSVQCTDIQWPKWSRQKKDNAKVHAKAPFYTWANNWFNAPCMYWPAKAGKPVKVDPRKAPPVLIINEERDAATPYGGALQARKIFPKSALISTPGGTQHSVSLRGNACVDNPIAEYLRTGALPKRQPGAGSDVECAPAPRPVATPGFAPAAEHPLDAALWRR